MPSSGGHPPPAQETPAAAAEDEEDEQQQQREAVGKASDGDANKDEHEEAPANLKYLIPCELNATFAVPDLVWGKVTGFPWWPGQILDPSFASRKAMKLRKEGRFLVAYFGDRTFAWCSASQLRPFLPAYEEMENQNPSGVFSLAVEEAVAEASRRVEMGMVCSCVPQELYSKVEYQIAENAGIRKGVSIATTDATFGPSALVPEEFLDYVRALAVCPKGESGRLDLVLAQAHLMAYRRSQGFGDLCSYSESKGLVENDDITTGQERLVQALRLIPKDESMLSGGVAGGLNVGSKDEEKLSDFISRKLGRKTWITSCRKRKSVSGNEKNYTKLPKTSECRNGSSQRPRDTVSDKKRKESTGSPFDLVEGSKKKSKLLDNAVKKSSSPVPYQSFQVGEFIQRFASKLSNSSPTLKSNGGTLQKSKVEDELSVDHKSERGESTSTSSSGEVPTSEKIKSMDGKTCSFDEVTEPPREIKYSRRPKRAHGPVEDQTPPKETRYLRRCKDRQISLENSTPPIEIKYSRRYRPRQSSEDDSPPEKFR